MMDPEPVFLNVYGAQESIPRNEFRQPMLPEPVFVNLIRSPEIDSLIRNLSFPFPLVTAKLIVDYFDI
jgi:hypothetical protein